MVLLLVRIRDDRWHKEAFEYTYHRLQEMKPELIRLETKYSTGDWLQSSIAQSLDSYLDLFIAGIILDIVNNNYET